MSYSQKVNCFTGESFYRKVRADICQEFGRFDGYLSLNSGLVVDMSLRKGLSRLFCLGSKQNLSKEAGSKHQAVAIKRIQHRGYLAENATEAIDSWKARINGKIVTGELDFIKQSIDWWCDNKTMLSPEKTTNQGKSKRKVEVYQGFKIINDTGELNGWYMLHGGQLLKGTKKAIEAKIDLSIERSRKKIR